jgi:hypothetical protein
MTFNFADFYSILETVDEARAFNSIFTNEGCNEGVEWQYRYYMLKKVGL